MGAIHRPDSIKRRKCARWGPSRIVDLPSAPGSRPTGQGPDDRGVVRGCRDERQARPASRAPANPQLCVHGGPEPGDDVHRQALVVIAELDDRNEPVPMQHGHVIVEIRRGMPAQEDDRDSRRFRPARHGGGCCDSRPGAMARERRSESESRFPELANLVGLQAGGTSRFCLDPR